MEANMRNIVDIEVAKFQEILLSIISNFDIKKSCEKQIIESIINNVMF